MSSKLDHLGESTDEEDGHNGKRTAPHTAHLSSAGPSAAAAVASQASSRPVQKESLGQKMKDKLTGSTHEERQRQRQQRAEADQRAYEQHRVFRQAMLMAERAGQPQLVGRDREGHDIFIEPPGGPGSHGWGMQYGGSRLPYNPYAANPTYSNPNARFIRPDYGYSSAPGYGYGGGIGIPLLGGLLLGGLLF